MLYLILADSELETVPPKVASDKSVQWKARKRCRRATELILDSNCYKTTRTLSEPNRRGRPDIVHVCMLAAMDSPLNREGLLRFYVHTRHDRIIEAHPKARIPRSCNRFIGMMEQLFLTGEVSQEGSFLRLGKGTLDNLVRRIKPGSTITLSERGRELGRKGIFQDIADGDVCVIVGGFPRGDFRSEVEAISDRIVSIYPKPLEALTIMTYVIQFYEDELDVIRESFKIKDSFKPGSENEGN